MDELIHTIVSRAQTLSERIGKKGKGSELSILNNLTEARLKEWRNACSLNEEDIFQRRLSHDNISSAELPFLLADSGLTENESLPDWTGRLKDVLKMLGQAGDDDMNWKAGYQKWAASEDYSGIPFIHLIYPFTRLAENGLQADLRNSMFSDQTRPVLRAQIRI